MMIDVIKELQSVTDLPLQIDTSNPETMEQALRIYNGKALINSVNGKQEVMEQIFPLVKKYGGTVVALTLDETGIPETTEGRIEIAIKILETAQKFGIDKNERRCNQYFIPRILLWRRVSYWNMGCYLCDKCIGDFTGRSGEVDFLILWRNHGRKNYLRFCIYEILR